MIAKSVQSAFAGTPLAAELEAAGCGAVVIAGVITNNSVEATARHAAMLGFDVHVVADACFTFGRRDWNGRWRSADEVHGLSLANLEGEYAKVVLSEEVMSALSGARPTAAFNAAPSSPLRS